VQRLEHLEGVKRVERRKDSYVLYTDHLQKSLLDFVRLTTEQHFTFTDLQTRTASLEDVFIEMTGRSLREE
jgi:ABC-2 type transport system ATP-binding protein